ncbi:hypothetical protein [Kitasatospora sp. NPDC057223]|uniref:AMIN-like domain-containing (lipo)protein n=1 Tax=Kitasatospora sp. NPDC057223 TaxID=3346055 RepID=UPI0036332A73
MRRQRWMMLPMVMLAGAGLAVAPSAPSAAVAAPAAVTCPTGWGSLPEDGAAGAARPLTGVRTGAHPCFDRLVLDVPGTSAAHPVGYHVRYVDRLVQDGSGKTLAVRGGAVIEVIATAPAYDPATGAQTYPGRAGSPLPGVDLNGYRTFVDARFASSFEGQSQIGLGVRARLPFRVFQLDDRLVIDVAHSWSGTR